MAHVFLCCDRRAQIHAMSQVPGGAEGGSISMCRVQHQCQVQGFRSCTRRPSSRGGGARLMFVNMYICECFNIYICECGRPSSGRVGEWDASNALKLWWRKTTRRVDRKDSRLPPTVVRQEDRSMTLTMSSTCFLWMIRRSGLLTIKRLCPLNSLVL